MSRPSKIMGIAQMDRYFFDVIGNEGPALDYEGRLMNTVDEAYNVAELMALDLSVKQEDAAIGSNVVVRNVHGQTLLSIPITQAYL
jgi:hypothetical protein